MGVFVIGALFSKKQPNSIEIASLVLAILILGFTVFVISPIVLRHGHIPNDVEKYTKHLEEGVVYELLASFGGGKGIAIFVKEQKGSEVFAFRVEGPVPPECFTIVNGQPVEFNQ